MIWSRSKSKPKPSAPAPRTRPLVLIIDDEADLCRILSMALVDAGYDVELAHDGVDGLAKARALRPSLILLDIRMPGLNGYQVLTHIQKDAGLAATPVIMITILEEAAQYSPAEWSRRLGVQGFLTKPFETAQAVQLVRVALESGRP